MAIETATRRNIEHQREYARGNPEALNLLAEYEKLEGQRAAEKSTSGQQDPAALRAVKTRIVEIRARLAELGFTV